MDNNMKELSPDKFHFQAKMQEWLEANRGIYTDFKSKIQSILKNLLCDNHSKQIRTGLWCRAVYLPLKETRRYGNFRNKRTESSSASTKR
ncbi:MAG TPA: hypothetical protein DCZ73_09740 [Bacteroides sp.]|nr:hypothetical protein [Bacteroides sp.]